MANGINKCMFLGNLTRDAELRSTKSGEPVMSFSVACSESYKDKSGQKQEKTEFVNCVLWGKRASALAQYMVKGTRVWVEGQMQTTSYEKDGQKRYKTEIKVNDVQLQGGGKRSENQPAAAATPEGSGYDDADYGMKDDDSIPF